MINTVTPVPKGTGVLLKAPLSGYILPIEQVPDPVFAQKMVGDGIYIDPLTPIKKGGKVKANPHLMLF